MSVRINHDQTGEDGLRLVEQRIFIQQIGAGVGRLVDLQGALIKFLGAVRNRQGEHLGMGSGGLELGKTFVTGLARSGVKID